MTPFFSDNLATILHGDCREVLPHLPADHFDTAITDPPYELNFMGKTWDATGVAFQPETWAGVLRVCKPGAFLLAFGGTRTFHRLTCAIEDGGWEIRDCMSWLYGSGFPKSLDISKAIDKAAGAERERIGRRVDVNGTPIGRDYENGKKHEGYQRPWRDCPAEEQNTAWLTAPATDAARQWNGWGTALKPAWEPIVVAMKPLAGTFAENAERHGVAGLNIDGGRIEGSYPAAGRKPQDIRGGRSVGAPPVRVSDDVQECHPSGRWPANVLLDEAAAEQLDQMSGEQKSGVAGRRGEVGMFNPGGYDTPWGGYGDSGGASRFFYTAKASKSDRGHGNDHATVKPTALLKYLCKLTATPTGGSIIDPFGGSMTTLVAAREMGRPATAIELDEGHCRIGVERLRQGVLFGIGGAA